MTSATRSAEAPPPSLARDLLLLARYYLGGRRRLLILAAAVLTVGLALNWGWLAAVGIAPILISLAPCAAMCALGLCMNKAGGKSCSSGPAARDTAATDGAASDDQTAAMEVSPATSVLQVPGAAVAASLADTARHSLKEGNTTDA
jgi:hypothetical protein